MLFFFALFSNPDYLGLVFLLFPLVSLLSAKCILSCVYLMNCSIILWFQDI